MDLKISQWIVSTFGDNKALAVIEKIITYAGSKWVILGIIGLLLIFKKTRKIGIYVFFAVGSVYVFNSLFLKNIIKRDRPFIVDESLKKMCELAEYEFPTGYSMASSHSGISMALAVSIFMQSKKMGIPAFIYSILVGISRIFLCVHFFSDVLVGFILGGVIAVLVYYSLNLLIKVYKNRREKNEKNSFSNSK